MRLALLACAMFALFPITATLGQEASRLVTVTPKETDDLLANPGMGWQTFHCFADEDRNLAGLPSSSAYFRLYWSDLEPKEGQIDFTKIDGLLARARRAGQKLAFRVMCAGTDEGQYMYVPSWLKDKGCKGYEYRYGGILGTKHWVPDFEDPIFQTAHYRLIEQLGKRYDGHPDFDLLDIGSVGLWGEWHMSDTGVDVPPLTTRLAIINAWCKAFPNTSKVMLIGDVDGLREAYRMGAGWRADCLGDMGGFSKTWNHMQNLYPQNIARSAGGTVWRQAPVAFETCWDMRKWQEEGWDIDVIFDYALDLHTSYLNNKSAPIPQGTRPQIERFLRKLGYRLVLRKLEHPATLTPGGTLALRMDWENVGVAPPYRDYILAARLTSASIKPLVLPARTSIKGWLPGQHSISESLQLPAALPPGRYRLSIGIIDRKTSEPAIRLPIPGRDAEGWYPLSEVEVR